MSCKNRERYNRNFKQAIDYESVVGQAAKLQRTNETEKLTDQERIKLKAGPNSFKKQYGRYGLHMASGRSPK